MGLRSRRAAKSPMPCSYRHRAVIVTVAVLTGCATDRQTAPEEDMGQIYRDARVCRVESSVPVNVRINSASIAQLKLDAGFDFARYKTCMERFGWTQGSGAGPLLAAQEECHEQTKTVPAASKKGKRTRIVGHRDVGAFAECMGAKGFDGKVFVGPLQEAEPSEPGGETPAE